MFLPQTIDISRSDKYILTIRIKTSGFMFSITDPNNGKNFCLRETTFQFDDSPLNNIQRIIFELSFLTQPFKEVNVIVVSNEYDIVPNKYFDIKRKEEIYDIVNSKKSSHLLSLENRNQDCTTVFNIDKEMYEFLLRSLFNPRFHHHTNLAISMFEDKGRAERNKMFVYFHDGYFDVLCFDDNKFLHCLTYDDEVAINQTYFILKLWEQCEFDQMKDFLYVAGDVEQETVLNIEKYIVNVDTIDRPSEVFFWSEDAEKAPLDLLSLSI